jgi:hypothetical protein
MLFGRMNSINPSGKFLKCPLGTSSRKEIFNNFAVGERFILSLAMHPCDPFHDEPEKNKLRTKSLVLSEPRKKGFIGFLVNIATYKRLYALYIHTGYLKYLLTSKTSHDHVEQLFCCIQGSLGKNNNPSTMEFTNNLKKILLGATHSSKFANCLIQDSIVNFKNLSIGRHKKAFSF